MHKVFTWSQVRRIERFRLHVPLLISTGFERLSFCVILGVLMSVKGHSILNVTVNIPDTRTVNLIAIFCCDCISG